MAMYKHGGDVHKAVKEKSMHHMAQPRKSGGRADSDEPDDGDASTDEPDVTTSYTAPSNVEKEAHGEERKKGGSVKKIVRKKGGKTEDKKIEGEAARRRMDRPGRKRGGGVGADTSPLTTANSTKERRGPSEANDKMGITGEE